MERYSIELAVDLARQLDLVSALRTWRSADEVCGALSFQPPFRFALGWILERLLETECIEGRTQDERRCYRLRHEPWEADLASLRDIGLSIDPCNAPTLDLLDRAASVYPPVARGAQRPGQNHPGP